ncbi:hypothetical protein Q7689_00920 [Nocardiopsis tropica]|uniref:hypothetical protein n=1 Tax=Nocardiopsis tropica TaxID=109330 RepID=UPI002E834F15|nr:hypothetical protein [Nocardiopsis tropica]
MTRRQLTHLTDLTWGIETTVVNGYSAVSFSRPWEKERHFLRVLDADQVRADLEALESIEQNLRPDWYVGFLIRTDLVSRLDGMWAQNPMASVVVHADRPDKLADRIDAARDQLGL